jgi:hypothetical protein
MQPPFLQHVAASSLPCGHRHNLEKLDATLGREILTRICNNEEENLPQMPRMTRHGKLFINPAASISKHRTPPSSALSRSRIVPSLITWLPDAIVP